jgi:hypothetical protein
MKTEKFWFRKSTFFIAWPCSYQGVIALIIFLCGFAVFGLAFLLVAPQNEMVALPFAVLGVIHGVFFLALMIRKTDWSGSDE